MLTAIETGHGQFSTTHSWRYLPWPISGWTNIAI